jgi:DNA-directed RNA polymerase I, II, and III subunit RPABC1
MSDTVINTNDIVINKTKKIHTAIHTLCRILIERKYTTKSLDDLIKKITPSINDDEMSFTIDDKSYGIKFINVNWNSINKDPSIANFLNKNPDNHKFIIVNKLSPKAMKQILEYKNTEIFTLDELLIVIIDHNIVPLHILLSEDEKNKYFSVFNHHPRDMKKILLNDPISRFYGAKVGDLFKIIRSSVTSGKEIDYRIVIPGEIKLDD